MTDCTYVGLPGFHGSARLFEAMAAACPEASSFIPIGLPNSEAMSYAELESWLLGKLPVARPWIIAESFSGPLAIRLAARVPVAGLVLSATFVRSPIPRLARALPLQRMGTIQPPRAAIRWALTGGDDELAGSVLQEMEQLPATVLAQRIRELLVVDVSRQLLRVSCPILYLQAARDRVVKPVSGREVLALRPDAVMQKVDAPHLLLQTAPKAAWTAIASFVQAQP